MLRMLMSLGVFVLNSKGSSVLLFDPLFSALWPTQPLIKHQMLNIKTESSVHTRSIHIHAKHRMMWKGARPSLAGFTMTK